MDLLNPLAGFLVGVLVGFTGVGGGRRSVRDGLRVDLPDRLALSLATPVREV